MAPPCRSVACYGGTQRLKGSHVGTVWHVLDVLTALTIMHS
jgi:hypothetical protein